MPDNEDFIDEDQTDVEEAMLIALGHTLGHVFSLE